jgi:hypothetical protein
MYAFATPNPASRGRNREAIELPFASNGRFVIVTGSFGLERFIVVLRPVT